jgi:CRISPR-associated endonuclease/helicase Cas3
MVGRIPAFSSVTVAWCRCTGVVSGKRACPTRRPGWLSAAGGAWNQFWAKRDTGSGTTEIEHWHPLIGHSIDVMMVARALWEVALAPSMRARMAASLGLEEDAAGHWISLWAGLHDIGKANPAFQGRSPEARTRLEQAGIVFPRVAGEATHGVVTAAVLPRLLQHSGLPAHLAMSISSAVGGHHGVFPRAKDWVDLGSRTTGDDRWWVGRAELYECLVRLTAGTRGTTPSLLSPADHCAFLLLAGLTCIADWIGSIKESFPPAGEIADPGAYASWARQQAFRSLDRLGWTRCQSPAPIAFGDCFGFAPNVLQTTVMEIGELLAEPALVVVEAPMGMGKTEAAFFLGDSWQSALGLAGGYVALPTEATSNQMFSRFRRFLARRYPEDRVNLHLVHGHAALSRDCREVRMSAEAEDSQARVVAEEWFTPRKRALLAPFGVGTVDQVLLAVLRVRHGFLRLFGLGGKLVIVDEVHAYDTYMSTLLDRALNWLSALSSPVLLLSATLPRERLVQLVQAYGGRDVEVPEAPYPRITWVSRSGVGCRSFAGPEPRVVRLQRVPGGPGAVAEKLVEAVVDGGCAVWICNTVGRAQEAYRALHGMARPDLTIDLFHAQYPYEEREKREHRVLADFGKDGSRPARSILVATQVIEQSLDVDFDLMVTDPAPIDLILQRAGRLHRHPRPSRPPGMEEPRLWLVEPQERDGAPDFGHSAAVYEEYLLLRSWVELADREALWLPQDIDPLIQSVYRTIEPREPTGVVAQLLQETRVRMSADRDEEERQATLRMIKPPWYRDNILEAFDADLDEEDPRVHAAFQAMTRLGPPSVGLVCLYANSSGPCLADDGSGPVDLQAKPSLDLVEELLRRSIRVSHRGLIPHLLAREVPAGWRRCPFLRHHRVAVFEGGVCAVADWAVALDPELGLVIRRQERDVQVQSR